MPFTGFLEALKPLFPHLTLERAIECITAHSGKGVLLLVDELMKTEWCEKNGVDDVVTKLASAWTVLIPHNSTPL
jgi:hypothetical protein